jgi:hypothetical protein
MHVDFHQQLARGAAHYQAGRFHEAHEAWEEAWRVEPRGPRRALLHGLVQVAAGLLKARQGRLQGAATLLTRALGHLWPLRAGLEGVALGPLVEAVEAAVRGLQAGTPPPAAPPLEVAFPEGLASAPPPGAAGPRPAWVPLSVSHPTRCPYCGERVALEVEGVGAPDEQYVEDCPVCCRPWAVRVRREADGVDVQVGRADG